ncbi:hypothetical protein AB4Z34_36305 [Ensifer sp. 2YAB10]|uniref:hypothetical protein n=1 Tax=Ensifer sp. 2YAB10 TaxID=3233021 RepID=UPI003F9053D7
MPETKAAGLAANATFYLVGIASHSPHRIGMIFDSSAHVIACIEEQGGKAAILGPKRAILKFGGGPEKGNLGNWILEKSRKALPNKGF